MFSRIKSLLGYGPEESEANRLSQDLLDVEDAETDGGISLSSGENRDLEPIDTSAAPEYFTDTNMREAWVRANRYPILTRIWSGLRTIKNQLQRGIGWILEKAFNTAFYLVAFNIAIALFARTIGFLAAGSFGWAALTLIPAFIAFRSTGPLSDFVSKVVTTIVPPVFSGLFYIVKAIASKVLAHCLRVTGIADYAMTAKPGEFFGKAKLPVVNVATNRDDEVDPNPDLTTNAAVYGPDINLGPFSIGTSIRANWSIVKYIKHFPQYIRHGLNWLAKKTGFEDFAKSVDTPLKRQERDYAMSDRGFAERELSDFESYLRGKNAELEDLGNKLDREIRTYIDNFPGLKNVSRADIEHAMRLASESQKQFITNARENLDAVINRDAGIVMGVAQTINQENFYNAQNESQIIEQGLFAKQRIDTAINMLSDSVVNSKNVFESVFAKEMESKPRMPEKPKPAAIDHEAAKKAMEEYEASLSPEEKQLQEMARLEWQNKRSAMQRAWQKSREESNATWNFAPAKTTSQIALEQEAESRRLQQEDEEDRPKFGTEQVHAGGRSYGNARQERKRRHSFNQ